MAAAERLIRLFPVGVALLAAGPYWLSAQSPIPAQALVSIEEATTRVPPEFRPVHEGQQLTIHGQVASKVIRIGDYSHLSLQDESGYGLVLEAPEFMFERISPGDRLEVQGILAIRDGMPVLRPAEIKTLASAVAPPIARLRLDELGTLRYVGLPVTTEGPIVAIGQDPGSEYLLLGQPGLPFKVVLPRDSRGTGAGLSRFSVGDRVRVTGLLSQAAQTPPFQRDFVLVVGGVDSLSLLEREWLISPQSMLAVLATLVVMAGLWYRRERRLGDQRRAINLLNALCEEVLTAGSAPGILKKLRAGLPEITGMSMVRMYLLHRGNNRAESVPSDEEPISRTFSLDQPPGPVEKGVVFCVRNRALLSISNMQTTALFGPMERERLPGALLLIPLLCQGELLGVLEISHTDKVRTFRRDEQASFQHLANEVALALKMLEQVSVREQLFHSEKLAATGQLISGIAKELKAPLDSIARLSHNLVDHGTREPDGELLAIANESHKASETLARLISFAGTEETEAVPLDVNAVLSGVMQLRTPEWQARGIEVRNLLSPSALWVLGSRSQLEQVFLNLMAHAEQALEDSPDRLLLIGSSSLARRVLIEVTYRYPASDLRESDLMEHSGGIGLGVCRGIIHGHGGELRLVRASDAALRFEVELPAAPAPDRRPLSGRRAAREFTVLIVEPDSMVSRRLLGSLSNRGHRVVPVRSAEEALDLAPRLKFDLLISSVRLPSMNWVELYERTREQVGAFVLLSEVQDTDVARLFPGGEGLLLRKPIEEAEIDRVLDTATERLSTPVNVDDE